MKYNVVGYYDNYYPILLTKWDTLEQAKDYKKEALVVFNTVKIFYNGEEVE